MRAWAKSSHEPASTSTLRPSEFSSSCATTASRDLGNYSAFAVEQGGEGDATVIAYHFAAGGRERDYRLRVEESSGTLIERDELSSFVSRWSVVAEGPGSAVTVEGSWNGAGGIAGIFERLFAPLGLRRIYGEMLDRLAAALVN